MQRRQVWIVREVGVARPAGLCRRAQPLNGRCCSPPKNLGSNVNTPWFDGAPALSFDGTTLYLVKRSNGWVDNDLYVTTRTRTGTGLSAGR
jgi:hypothetical protein